MQASSETSQNADTPLQLLLFVDKRPSSREQVRQVRTTLQALREECDFELQIIDVVEQPYLAEYFRLIATPALLKIHPEPRQVLAGSNLEQQLRQWWSHWQRSAAEYLAQVASSQSKLEPMEKVLLAASNQAQRQQTSATQASPSSDSTLEFSSEPALAADDRRLGESGLVQSVSYSAELLRLADEVFRLRREKEEYQHQLQFKDQIIAMLAHDLRNPLTATSIALETLEMGYNSGDGSSRLAPALTLQLLKQARIQTRAIDRMITDILQAARGTGSELKIQVQKLDLAALCLDVLKHLSDRLQAKALRVEQDIPSDLPKVLADAERMRQVLTNLLDNAIKYTPPGGLIQLSALHRTTQKIQISVCDDGPGIPPEHQEQIFEERYRLERDGNKDGYGIGLYLCQRIVRAHYGRIWVDSTPNQGSCFHFTLPVFRT